MLCSTHRLIAQKVYEVLNNKYGNFIDLKSLLYGSVAPDSIPSMVIIPHTRSNSSKYLFSRIESLLLLDDEKKEIDMKDFSYKLGIVIHFISDYFCNAHNDFKYINPLTHFLYENRLKKFFLKKVHLFNFSSECKRFGTLTGIRKYILEKHNEYMLCPRNMDNDFSYSIETSLTVSINVFSQVVQKLSLPIQLEDARFKTRTA